MADPFALNEDGTARDPAAFREALRADPVKMEALEKVVLGEDEHAFQELIKSVYQVGLTLQSYRCRRRASAARGSRWATSPPPPPPAVARRQARASVTSGPAPSPTRIALFPPLA